MFDARITIRQGTATCFLDLFRFQLKKLRPDCLGRN